jgi:hypothetical protein
LFGQAYHPTPPPTHVKKLDRFIAMQQKLFTFMKKPSLQKSAGKLTAKIFMRWTHRHLRNIDCLTARVFFISTVNGRSKKRRKETYY